MENSKSKIVMVGGPTAVGKTALAIELAQKLDGVIINADAFQIYRGMDIGTAKPTAAEQAAAEHRLIDIVEPGTEFTVARFMERATAEIDDVLRTGRLPILVGGTGFYLNALRLGLPLGEAGASTVRQKWQAVVDTQGPEWAWRELERRDPVAAAAIPAANSRRVVRALEVIETTGDLFSHQAEPTPQYDSLVIGLMTDREILYNRINARIDQMLTDGLLAEVERVMAVAGPNAQALAAIGYKEFVPYLQGQVSLTDAVELVKRNSRRYAKRQLTYFRNQMDPHWFDLIQEPDTMAAVVSLIRTWRRK